MSTRLPDAAAVDSSFIINVCNGNADAVKALSVLEDKGTAIYIPTPVWTEIGRGPGGEQRLAQFGLMAAPLNVGASRFLAQHLGKKAKTNPCGRYVWDADAQTYACAIVAGCDSLITDNARDFDSIARSAPAIAKRLVLWTSSMLAKYAKNEQLKLVR